MPEEMVVICGDDIAPNPTCAPAYGIGGSALQIRAAVDPASAGFRI